MKRIHVCSFVSASGVSCHNLTPCPVHSRPKNAPWSKDRNRGAQQRFRDAVLARDGHRCSRCGRSDIPLVAHHVKPGYAVDVGVTLCQDCHKLVDDKAR